MKILPWLAFLLSLALIAAVFRMASDSEIVGPERIYKETIDAYSRGRIGAEGAIDRLETAISLAEAEGKTNLIANLYTERGRFFLQMNGLNRAREDFLRVLEVYRPGDLDVERLLVEVEMKAKNYDQAQERLKDILDSDRGDSTAWAMLGRLALLSGQEKMAAAEKAISRTLVAEDSETATRLLRRITARHPRDPSRVALVRTLRSLFSREDDEIVRRVLDIADSVSADNQGARKASASSLSQRINAPAAQQILGLFSNAERHEEAARLGLLLTERPVVRNNSVATLRILRSMKALGRTKTAVEVLSPWQRKNLTVDDPAFYELGCQLLYDAEQWTDLFALAQTMKRRSYDDQRTRLAFYYAGSALVEVRSFDAGAKQLERSVNGLETDYFPGGRSMAYQRLATAYRELKDTREELTALLRVTEVDPECPGEIRLRVTSLMDNSANRVPLVPLRHLTHAMAMLPKRTEELFPLWVELGERDLSTSAVSLRSVYDRLRVNNQWLPAVDATPYRIYQLGEMYKADGRWIGLISTARRILEDYPGFLPALDQLIEAQIQLDNIDQAIDLTLDRLELVGMDEKTTELIARENALQANGPRLLRMMRADPTHTARLTIARHSASRGRTEEALTFLRSGISALAGGVRSKPELTLIAELELDSKRWSDALATIERLEERGVPLERTLPMRIRAAANRSTNPLAVENAVEEYLALDIVSPDAALEISDQLLLAGRLDLARRALVRLDRSASSRSGELFLRLARIDMLDSSLEAAATSLMRAEPYMNDGRVELAEALLAIRSSRWVDLPLIAERLRETDWEPSPLSEAICLLFEEKLEDALDAALVGTARNENDERWRILLGVCRAFENQPILQPEWFGSDRPRDLQRLVLGSQDARLNPRRVLALLLSIEEEFFLPYAKDLNRAFTSPVVGPLWQIYFDGVIAMESGDFDHAFDRFEAVHGIRPEFAPAWARHEELLERSGRTRRLADAEDPIAEDPRLALRFQRASAKVPSGENVPGTNPLDVELVNVRRALENNKFEQAEVGARTLVDKYPDSPFAQATLAQALQKRGEWAEGFRAWAKACLNSEPASDLIYVPETLEALERALRGREQESLKGDEIGRILLDLHEHLPDDPSLVLELARRDIEDEPIDPASGVDRALARTARFIDAHPGMSLDDLRAGSTRAWTRFYNQIEPGRAAAFLESQFLERPGELELWLLRGEVLRAQGKYDEALEHTKRLVALAPEPRVLRELVSILSVMGTDHDLLDETLVRIKDLEELPGLDDQLVIDRAEGLLNGGIQLDPNTVSSLQRIWNRGQDIASRDDVVRTLVSALLMRGTDPDLEEARGLLDQCLAERIGDDYADPWYRSLIGLTYRIRRESDAEASLESPN